MSSKRRLSVSVDADLVEAAERAVADERVPTVSAWVNAALREKLERDRRLGALAAFVAEYESEQGVITEDEVRTAARRARGPTRSRRER